MIDVSVILDKAGGISRLSLEGHAGGAPGGENLACAAVSLLVRSVARLLASKPGWLVEGNAPKPGSFYLSVQRHSLAEQRHFDDMTQWLKGITDTLLQALADVGEEYPSTLSVEIERKE
ncbi:MAG: hypothetical protein B0D92_08340 [Spirochaeta sp. LUC14_002_19_P3]|nr:MAG: hypothetical protein B0D92_08340 [Spirochaeta sp. LUC14_002_19_P3]